jgi:hypothetical protein
MCSIWHIDIGYAGGWLRILWLFFAICGRTSAYQAPLQMPIFRDSGQKVPGFYSSLPDVKMPLF